MAANPMPTYTIIQADGLYPDEVVEHEIFTKDPTHKYNIDYQQTYLWPPGTPTNKPWSAIPADLREKVDGIMVLKMAFTKEDAELFPNLKV